MFLLPEQIFRIDSKKGGKILRLVRTEYVEPGMMLGKNVYDANANLLLSCGVELTEDYIKQLQKNGQNYLYISDIGCQDSIDFPEPISEKLRIEAAKFIRKSIEKIRRGHREINVHGLKHIADKIIRELRQDKNTFIGMADPRPVEDYLYRHSINVCVISLVMAKSLFSSNETLKEIAIGALLHDIGKAFIPVEILEKEDELGLEEMEKVKEHARFGYILLSKYKTISLFTRHVPYQHHERADGSGYPRGIENTQITDFAKIVSLVDAFEAMTADRSYKKGVRASKAIKELFKIRNIFDPEIVKIFLKTIAPFRIGEKIRLSTGETGYVFRINPKEIDRPLVSVEKEGVKVLVDLSKEKRIDIEPA